MFNKITNFLAGISWRERLLIILAGLVVFVFLSFSLLFKPVLENGAKLKTEIKIMEEEFRSRQELAQRVKAQAKEAVGAVQNILFFHDFSELLAFIGREAHRQNITVVSFYPKGADKSADKTTEKTGQITSSGNSLAELKMKGTYPSFYKFFEEISKTRYQVGFQSVEIKSVVQDYPVLSADLVLVTNYAKR